VRRYIVGFAVGALLVTTGTAVAAIPDGSDVIHGCYKTAPPHALRVIDSERRLVSGRWVQEFCFADETPLNWHQDP